MTIERLDHYSVRTENVERSVVFYENAMGLRRGMRPPFNFPGAWLYRVCPSGEIEGASVVHIVGIDANDKTGLIDYLGDKPISLDGGSGAIDHIAFFASNITDMYARLAHHRISYRERMVPILDLHQIFLEDPDGVTIELNYSRPEDIAAAQRSVIPTTS
jgi:catechol 2,3-dioxygenase-like lactoylglutathione lyase family enzyme